MSTIFFSDLDERPYLAPRVLEMFTAAGPGRHHAVCGEPQRMGMPPNLQDFEHSMGVLLALEEGHLSGALCLCPYSDEQVTLWGPVSHNGFDPELASMLLERAKEALSKNDFSSFRILVDSRNRQTYEFLINKGLHDFQKNILYARDIHKPAELPEYAVQLARSEEELLLVHNILNNAFPENGHCSLELTTRIEQGYFHYILKFHDAIAGCAVISRNQRRSWLSLLCIDNAYRGNGLSKHLLNGAINCEYAAEQKEIALEVLANNKPAKALYKHCGFQKQWEASILTGPV